MTAIGVILGSNCPRRLGEPVTRRAMAEAARRTNAAEYDHSTSGVLKNAFDCLYSEWNNRAMGAVSYGIIGGARAAEHLPLIAGAQAA